MNLELDDKRKQSEVIDEVGEERLQSPSSLAIELISLENEAVNTDVTALKER